MGRKITALLRSKKVVLFPEIGRVKNVFITHPPALSNVCQFFFNFKKKKKRKRKQQQQQQQKKQDKKKQKKVGKKRISEERSNRIR